MREKPSSRMSRIVPSPSTWPWTTWPPRRSEARSGSSRLTSAPSATSASEERRRVSRITSAVNRPSSIAVAVRQTPLTETLSPSPISGASAVRTASRTPSAVASTAVTVPLSATSPVNIRRSPLAHPGGDQHVVGDPAALERECPGGLGDALDALALERVARGGAADHDRRDEQADLVHLAGVQEGARQVRAALEQDRGHAGGAELYERVLDAGRLVLAGGDDHVGARGLEPVGGAARGGARDDDRQRQLGGALDQRGVQRQAGLGVEDDPARLVVHVLDPGGQLRVVGERGADAARDGVALGPPAVRDAPRVVAGDPLRVARAGRDLAVERHRGLEQDPGDARAGVLAEGLVEQPRAGGQLALGDHDLDALVAQDPEPAAGGLLRRVVGADDDAG